MAKKTWIVIRKIETGVCEPWEQDREFPFDCEQVAGPFFKKQDATSWIDWVGKNGVVEELDDEDDLETLADESVT